MSASFESENNEKTKSSNNHCFLLLQNKTNEKKIQLVYFPVTNITQQKKGVLN